MKNIRHSRKLLLSIRDLLGRPLPWTWTGGHAFNRAKRTTKFQDLVAHLDAGQFRHFCSAIGFIEVNWAFFESQMDRWVQIAYVRLKIKHGGKEAPTSFARKSAYLKGAFKHPYLSQFRTVALELLAEAERLAETRHDVTHGVITSIEPVDFFKFTLENRKLRGTGMHTMKNITFDVRDFPKIARDLVDLGARSVRLTAALGDKFL